MKSTKALLTGMIAAAALLLSGCLSMEGEVTYDDQARGDGKAAVSVSKSAASMLGIASLHAFESAVRQSDGEDEDLGFLGSGEITVSESDTDYIMTATFTQATFDDDEWRVSINDEGNLDFLFVNEGTVDDEVFGDSEIGRVDLTMNFPGEVLEFSGEGATKVDGNTVRWQFPMSTTTTLTATSAVPAGGSSFTPVLLVSGVGLAAAGGVTGVAVSRRRAAGRAQAVGGPEVADASGTVEAGAASGAADPDVTVGAGTA